jgi:sulfane dehydrogenase subunit SoxC
MKSVADDSLDAPRLDKKFGGALVSTRGNGASRRRFLQLGAAIGGALTALRPGAGHAQVQPAGARALGGPVSGYGGRSPHETAVRLARAGGLQQASSSTTPLHELHGIITPSSLHFERHHTGVPALDPAAHELLVHGLVDRPLVFSVEELKRLPAVSRVYFLECSGNSGSAWRGVTETDAQRAHGLTSCSEWTGVPVAVLLREAGMRPSAAWVVAEGADAGRMTRSLPFEKALADALVAYGHNGEALRPEQGYPLRLLVPGWEGNISVKWLRRLHVVDRPYMTREETSKYTDLLPDGSARQFTFVMDAKSVITRPSPGQRLPEPGSYEIRGLAWSGRGTVARVEISTDGGRTWKTARLQEPVLPLAHTRFCLEWTWRGNEAILQSRCIDDTGDVQPTQAALIAARGRNSTYHNNAIQSWKVQPDGSVLHVDV